MTIQFMINHCSSWRLWNSTSNESFDKSIGISLALRTLPLPESLPSSKACLLGSTLVGWIWESIFGVSPTLDRHALVEASSSLDVLKRKMITPWIFLTKNIDRLNCILNVSRGKNPWKHYAESTLNTVLHIGFFFSWNRIVAVQSTDLISSI